jgi:hypothetical protein
MHNLTLNTKEINLNLTLVVHNLRSRKCEKIALCDSSRLRPLNKIPDSCLLRARTRAKQNITFSGFDHSSR